MSTSELAARFGLGILGLIMAYSMIRHPGVMRHYLASSPAPLRLLYHGVRFASALLFVLSVMAAAVADMESFLTMIGYAGNFFLFGYAPIAFAPLYFFIRKGRADRSTPLGT